MRDASKSCIYDLNLRTKYGAVQTIGSRMYIDPDQGMILMNQYLEDKIDKK